MNKERGLIEKRHGGVTYTHIEMYHNEGDAEEKAKELQTRGHLTWIEKGGSEEYYPYHLYYK